MPEGPSYGGTVASDRLVARRQDCKGHAPGNREVASMKVAVVKETAPGERRGALVPGMIGRLRDAGLDVLVESGAGDGAWLADGAYADAGAAIVSRDELLATADLIMMVGRPDEQMAGRLMPGQAIDRKSTRLN